MADATFKFCERDIGMIGMGVMTPGGKLQPLIFSYVPTESAEAYCNVWNSFEKSAISFVTKFQRCGKEHCDVCDKIVAVLQGEVTAKELSAFRRTKRLPTDFATSDNNMAYKKFCSTSMGLEACQCISHLTGK